MKLLVATALLLCIAADAYHTSQHKLLGPMFQEGKTYFYNLTMDISASIAGISAQTAKSSLNAELGINPKSQREHIFTLKNVRVSGSQKSVPSYSSYLRLQRDSALESSLALPVKFTLEKGQVTSYTMSKEETLETRKIKKGILRMIEMYVDENSVKNMETRSIGEIPVTYNLTRKSQTGEYQSHYIITASPYPNFPMETNVYNISRSDNYENIRYPGHKFHHNLKQQGCAEVCRRDWQENKNGAGCPSGSEPHQSPVKLYYTHHHHLAAKEGIMVPEIIEVTETHVANYYDQDMKIFIRAYMRLKNVINRGDLHGPSGEVQQHSNLEDYEEEIDTQELNNFCSYESPKVAVDTAKKLLDELSEIVSKSELEERKTTLIGEKLVLLQKSLQMISQSDFEKIESDIPKLGTLIHASDKDRIKRQIWTNVLSVVGTKQSIAYISSYIERSVGRELTVWEAKEILESLPENIHKPSEQNIRDLKKLWSVNKVKEHHILHSAAYLTVSRVIKNLCEEELINSEEQASSWMGDYYRVLRNFRLAQSSETTSVKCPKSLVKETVQNIIQKFENTQSKQEKAVYIQALAHISTPEALQQLAKYALGIAEDIHQYTPSQVSFFRTLTLSTLHNAAKKHPQAVLSVVAPIYFNKTEEPKVRTAAFSILLRSQPSRELLEHVAHDTWYETSKEVGSYVTSSLESLGNSTLPCDQLTAQRIKMVISQAKRFDIGIHHAKSYRSSYNDVSRFFSGEGKFEYTPSNESIIPSNIYYSHTYSISNLKGVIVQNGLNIQGLTSKSLEDYLDENFGIKSGKPLSPGKESELFRQLELENIVPEKLRMSLKHRLFYQSSFYYIENVAKDIAPLVDHINRYFKAPNNNYRGTYLKMLIPSSVHTDSVAKALPFPVETEMRHPILVAISIKNEGKTGKIELRRMHISLRLSVYGTRMLTSHIKALRDCKEVGTYYEEKFAASIPVELKVDVEQWNRIIVEYTIKNLPKNVLTLRAEAGTYAGKKSLESLPHMIERAPIKTVPVQFKTEKELNVVGVPPIQVAVHTENIREFTDIPLTVQDAQEWVIQKLMNAGWRQRSINITLSTDSSYWPVNNKVTFKLNYGRENVFPRQSNMYQSQAQQDREHQAHLQASESNETEDDIVREMNVVDDVSPRKAVNVIGIGKKIFQKIIHRLPHMRHTVDLQVLSSSGSNKAVLKAVYNHTMGRHLHSFHVDAKVNIKSLPVPLEISADHIMGFLNRLSEFKFDKRSYQRQKGLFLSTLSLHQAAPYENVDIVSYGSMKRIPSSQILNDLLVTKLDEKHFLPEDHEICERHTEQGKALSPECRRSIRELSHYNKYKLRATWTEGKLPKIVKIVANRMELITRALALGHVEVSDRSETARGESIDLHVAYIDKLTDEPLLDIVLEKPNEIVKYNKVKAGFIQPLSSIDNVIDSYILAATNYSYPATCHVMQNYLTTYDEVTHPFPTSQCQYLISAHCIELKKFAVIGKNIDSQEGTKEITLYVGEHELRLSPKQGLTYEVKFNGQKKTIHPLKPQQLGDEETQLLVVMNTDVQGAFLEVYYPFIHLKLTYDGTHVKIQVPPQYKGELCGLCSSFDGEVSRELFAADQCLYSSVDDFIRRAIVNPEECHERNYPTGEPLCYKQSGHHQHTDTVVRRNMIQYKEDQICFSILPIRMCSSGKQPEESEEATIGFHCLPERDSTARRLVEESKTRVLSMMRSKSVDYTETVSSAVRC